MWTKPQTPIQWRALHCSLPAGWGWWNIKHYLHTCKQLLPFLHAPQNSLRMTQVSNENNINRPSSAQSRAIIISAQSRRWKEAWGESRALWVGIMQIKKKSTSLHEHTEGVAMRVWAIKRSYWQCWIWLSNMYGCCPWNKLKWLNLSKHIRCLLSTMTGWSML